MTEVYDHFYNLTGIPAKGDHAMTTTPGANLMMLRDGYDRSKNPAQAMYRPMTVDEAKRLTPGSHATILATDGSARTVKINGQPKTWKRDPTRVEVPVKYGMYEYATLRAMPDGMMERLIVKVIEGDYNV